MSRELRVRIPTFAVMILTAGLVIMLALALMPLPQGTVEKFSVRERRESDRALQEAIASAQVAAATHRNAETPALLGQKPPKTAITDQDTYAAEMSQDSKIQLAVAPIAELTEPFGADATLPRIADDGRAPWQVYARPAGASSAAPKAVIVVAGLGINHSITNEAIERLPGAITLVIDAQARDVRDILQAARQAGHETLLALPAEPFDYPHSDPGPDTLLTNLSTNENTRRLRHFMSLGSGYVGLTTLSGDRFISIPKSAQLLLKESRQRGLALFDARLNGKAALHDQAGVERKLIAVADLTIEADMTVQEIDGLLAQVETLGRQQGAVICLVYASPLVIDRLHHWLPTLPELGIALSPLSVALH